MRNRIVLSVVALVAIASAVQPASAAEVVRFTDGRYLEVAAHEIHGKGIRLTVERGGVIVLPLAQVEKIERGGLVVFHVDDERSDPRKGPRAEPEPSVAVARLEASTDTRRPERRTPRR